MKEIQVLLRRNRPYGAKEVVRTGEKATSDALKAKMERVATENRRGGYIENGCAAGTMEKIERPNDNTGKPLMAQPRRETGCGIVSARPKRPPGGEEDKRRLILRIHENKKSNGLRTHPT